MTNTNIYAITNSTYTLLHCPVLFLHLYRSLLPLALAHRLRCSDSHVTNARCTPLGGPLAHFHLSPPPSAHTARAHAFTYLALYLFTFIAHVRVLSLRLG